MFGIIDSVDIFIWLCGVLCVVGLIIGVFRLVFCFDVFVLCCYFVRYLNGGKYFIGVLIIM